MVIGVVVSALVVAAVGWALLHGLSKPSPPTSASNLNGPKATVTLTGENRIKNLGLHNDVGTPCGPPPFSGAPPFNLFFIDNVQKPKLRLTVRVDPGSSGSTHFNVVGDLFTGVHADLTSSGYTETATSGTVDLTTSKTGKFTFIFAIPDPKKGTPPLPFVTGLPLTVTGEFNCV